MKSPFLQSLKDCGVGLLVATIITTVGFSMQSPQARMGMREILILGLCCAVVIAVVGLPISYLARRLFARSATMISPLIFGAIGFILSQAILFLITLVFLSTNGGNALDSTISILYEREWRALTAAFAATGAVIGALSLINKKAEQVETYNHY
ncbi:MAG: hypothetical protein ACSHX0_12890 [Akkermansiaceae bacterium]